MSNCQSDFSWASNGISRIGLELGMHLRADWKQNKRFNDFVTSPPHWLNSFKDKMCTSKWFHFISSIYLVGRWIKENWPRQRSHQRHKAAIEKIRWYLVKQVPAQGNRDSIVSILKCFLLAAELWLKPISDIAWVPFDLQEHKIHNKISLFMDFFFINFTCSSYLSQPPHLVMV